jgi:hypothetical protein
MRDNRSIIAYSKEQREKSKESLLNKLLRTEVEVGANGTQKYVIKHGKNKGKVAEGFQK